MHEEEWGFFIDLELHPSQIQKEIQTKKMENSIKPNINEKKILGRNCLSIIYEDEVWYKRDE